MSDILNVYDVEDFSVLKLKILIFLEIRDNKYVYCLILCSLP